MAYALAALVLGLGYIWLPPSLFGLSESLTIGDQIAFALKFDIMLLLWVAWCVRRASGTAFRGSGEKGQTEILQNSLEQTFLAFGAHMILATLLRGPELVIIPLLVLLFIIGRLVFTLAYHQSAYWRGFGMALTAAPTDACLVVATSLIVTGRSL